MTTPRVAPLPAPREPEPDEPTLTVGRYQGWPLREIPAFYLCWALSQPWLPQRSLHAYRAVRPEVIRRLREEEAKEASAGRKTARQQ